MHLKEGTSLQGGRYRIEKVLGQGGFGITYLGVQVGLNRQVAIKEFFMKEYCNREEETSYVTVPSVGSKELVKRFRQKFVKEAQTISELENYHIVRIYDVFEENKTAYYVMEYLSGGDLRTRIPEGGMPETEALLYIRQIADALMFVHERNILHLDIKPGNVLFRSNGETVLVDFGLSKHYDESSGEQTSSTPLGISEGYAPTEQYENSGVSSFSPATDIYSLGATFYCLLQGSRPPKASIVLNDGLPALPLHLSSATRKTIESAMQPRRNDRPQAVDAFLSLLDSSLETDDDETFVDIDSSEPEHPVPSVPEVKPFPRKWLKPLVFCLATALCFWGVYECIGPRPIGGGGNAIDSLSTDILVPVRNSVQEEPSKLVQTVESTSGTINGHEYVELGLNVKWATMNVGASRPGDYGDYFAWGEVHLKPKYKNKFKRKSIDETNGNSQYDAARYHWGGSWRLPTEEEFQELMNKCRWTWTEQDGHDGYKVVGPNGNSIFLPAAGDRRKASTYNVGTHGYYWGASDGSLAQSAYCLYFYDDFRGMYWNDRTLGPSVRLVSD